MKQMFIAVALTLYASHAATADLSEIDCSMIRAKVAEHGRIVSYAWALAHGYTPREIARIRRKCGV